MYTESDKKFKRESAAPNYNQIVHYILTVIRGICADPNIVDNIISLTQVPCLTI